MLLLRALLLSAISVLLATSAQGRKGFGPGEQEYGYVDVRKGAHMFYWLYYTTATSSYTERPLVMWLQGGPGLSSTSYGNFEEIGPLTSDLKPRNTTWVQHINLLLVDNPVGTGFSYVDNHQLLTSTNTEVARDLVELTRGFLKQYPSFQTVPFYVFSENYGGKMAAEFALELEKERKSGKIKVNFQGVSLGAPWISPIDAVMNWAPFLHNTGFLDHAGYTNVDIYAKVTKAAVDRGQFLDAADMWITTMVVVWIIAGNVDYYNILTPVKWIPDKSDATIAGRRYLLDEKVSDADLDTLMNGPVRRAFGETIPSSVHHVTLARNVYGNLYGEIMKPVTDVVEELLNTTTLQVVVYSGQLGLIAPPLGIEAWVDRLKWPMAEFWNKEAKRQKFVVNGIVEGFVKQAKNFSRYWINRAGSRVPVDNPAAAIEILRIVTKFDKK